MLFSYHNFSCSVYTTTMDKKPPMHPRKRPTWIHNLHSKTHSLPYLLTILRWVNGNGYRFLCSGFRVSWSRVPSFSTKNWKAQSRVIILKTYQPGVTSKVNKWPWWISQAQLSQQRQFVVIKLGTFARNLQLNRRQRTVQINKTRMVDLIRIILYEIRVWTKTQT